MLGGLPLTPSVHTSPAACDAFQLEVMVADLNKSVIVVAPMTSDITDETPHPPPSALKVIGPWLHCPRMNTMLEDILVC